MTLIFTFVFYEMGTTPAFPSACGSCEDHMR